MIALLIPGRKPYIWVFWSVVTFINGSWKRGLWSWCKDTDRHLVGCEVSKISAASSSVCYGSHLIMKPWSRRPEKSSPLAVWNPPWTAARSPAEEEQLTLPCWQISTCLVTFWVDYCVGPLVVVLWICIFSWS